MSFSEAEVTLVSTADIVSPGKGTITEARQLDNHTLVIKGTNPVADSDGSNLTGLSGRYQVYAPVVEGVNPFVVTDPDGNVTVKPSAEILALSGTQQVFEVLQEDEDAGQPWEDHLGIASPGATFAIATIYTDDEGVIA